MSVKNVFPNCNGHSALHAWKEFSAIKIKIWYKKLLMKF